MGLADLGILDAKPGVLIKLYGFGFEVLSRASGWNRIFFLLIDLSTSLPDHDVSLDTS